MLRRLCLFFFIPSCRVVVGRLPVDIPPVNTFQDDGALVVTKFSGVHTIVYVNRIFYILSKNQVTSLEIIANDGNAQHKLSEVITWPSATSADNLCRAKTRNTGACNNFVRVFAPKDAVGNTFLVCGTHSFDPKCRTYSKRAGSLKKDIRNGEFSGKSICPYDPEQTGASLYTGGDIYAGTFEDFLGQKPVIYRHAVSSSREDIERKKRDETWLLDPWFVKFVDADLKVYVLFKETAIEDKSGLTYSRVGQLCKSDNGGELVLRKQFTSFVKARLNCSYPGDPPFYFDELAAATDFYELPGQPGERIMLAAMNTPKNSIWGSALCAYEEKDIERAFRAPFLEQHVGDESVTYWSEKESEATVTEALSSCQFDEFGKPVLSSKNLQFVRDHPLKSRAVPTWSKHGDGIPLFTKLDARYQFSAIIADPHAGSNRQHFVVFLGTTDGKLLKIIPPLTSSSKRSHFVSETEAYDEKKCGETGKHDRHVRDIKIDKGNGFVIVAFSSCVVTVSLCPVSSECQRACIAARDPYCAWDGERCTGVLHPHGLEQDVLNGDVTGLPHCGTKPGSEVGTGDGDLGAGAKPTSFTNATSVPESNETATSFAEKDQTSPPAVHLKTSFAQAIIIPGIIGVVIGAVVFCVLLSLICFLRKRSRKAAAEKQSSGERTLLKETESLNDGNRNPHSYNNQRSKPSDSSVEEDDPFFGDELESNANSLEKARRKREMSANRASTASSYHKDSIERPSHFGDVGRQPSRESNPETAEPEEILYMADFTQAPSPQTHVMYRTISASGARPETMASRQGNRELRRNFSLQVKSNGQVPYHHQNLASARYTLQSPLEQHPMHEAPTPQGAFDPAWRHPPPSKSTRPAMQFQTTSLDRKMLKTGGPAHKVHADTLPQPDDPKNQNRRRYTSETVTAGNRHPSMFYASKQPTYQSIEEETSPPPDQQHSPMKFPPNIDPRTVGRARPNHLPLGGPADQYIGPYSTPAMNEQMSRLALSPMSKAGHSTLPTHVRRQTSEGPPRSYAPADFPHPQSASNVRAHLPGERKLPMNNPTTPVWNGENDGLPGPLTDAAATRGRNPSGKTGTPTTPKNEFPGFGHPDVIPMTTTRTQPDGTFINSNNALETIA